MPQGLTSKDLVTSHTKPRTRSGLQRKTVTPQDKIVSDLYKNAPRYGPSDLLRGMLQADSKKTKTKTLGPAKTNYMDPISAINMLAQPTRTNDFDVRQFIRDIPYNLGFGTPEDIALNLNPADKLFAKGIEYAGLPFLALRRKLLGATEKTPLKDLAIYRGAKVWRPDLEPRHYQTSDTLGWMTHAASDPDYATSYANGHMKSSGVNWDNDARAIAQWERQSGKKFRPNIRPMILHNKNTLDLMDPNMDDILEAINAIARDTGPNGRSWRAEGYLDELKNAVKTRNEQSIKSTLQDIASRMRSDMENPKIFKNTTFDAIRYNDAGYEAWAFPEETLNTATTPWGVPIQTSHGENFHGVDPLSRRFIADPSGNIEDKAKPLVSKQKKQFTNPAGLKIGDTVELQHPGGYTTSHTINSDHDINTVEDYVNQGAQIMSSTSKPKPFEVKKPTGQTGGKSIPVGGIAGQTSLKIDMKSTPGMEFKLGDQFQLQWPDGHIQDIHLKSQQDLWELEHAITNAGADFPSGQVPYSPTPTPSAANLPYDPSQAISVNNNPYIDAMANPDNYTIKWAGKDIPFSQWLAHQKAKDTGTQNFENSLKNYPDIWGPHWPPNKTTPTPSIQLPSTSNPIKVGGGYSGPSITISNPSDYSWLGPSPNLTYENVAPAGGSHQGLIARALGSNNPNITDPRFVFKASGARAGLGEQFGSAIANYLNERTPYAPYGNWSGLGTGNLQYMVPKASNMFTGQVTPDVLSQMTLGHMHQLGEEHPIDWLLGNFDAHKGQFLIAPGHSGQLTGGTDVIPIDKGQAFKHYKSGILEHPNAVYGEDKPIYHYLRDMPSGTLRKNSAREGAMEMVDKIDPSWFMDQMEQYGQKRKDMDSLFNLPEFLKIQESKVKSLKPVIENYWK